MKKLIIALLFALPVAVMAAGGAHLEKANIDLSDKASLQRGAKLFVNYCLSCHSAAYQRYNRMGRDIGLSDAQVQENLMLAGEKVGETMTIAMPQSDAKRWFGNPPPDLSVMARARGTDYIYTYLKTFYIDENRPFGVNNAVFPDVGMPHVLWELEGQKKAITKTETDADGNETTVITGYEVVKPGSMSEAEYDQAARDMTNFMVYMSEPVVLKRQQIGIWVLLFLGIFFIVAYALKKEYWKDVH
ncbi:MAG: cytochrome c1 [Gammaproteobacteria bacterium]|nr:cytochrome c1 [Gammaproteobacteria bacterium]MCW8840484.1 cytochrome c1 [Gammaproteobacteria bacterium]MCW8928380.1 cytochrome c1 [Gammaproteobacteria bacterium]MCW8959715.1 cytochrome c1 [Gammaproteobacteria bacterium]MCW8971912.1 cytochrome c1 [Gammaproteobacteria bacterium]